MIGTCLWIAYDIRCLYIAATANRAGFIRDLTGIAASSLCFGQDGIDSAIQDAQCVHLINNKIRVMQYSSLIYSYFTLDDSYRAIKIT